MSVLSATSGHTFGHGPAPSRIVSVVGQIAKRRRREFVRNGFTRYARMPGTVRPQPSRRCRRRTGMTLSDAEGFRDRRGPRASWGLAAWILRTQHDRQGLQRAHWKEAAGADQQAAVCRTPT